MVVAVARLFDVTEQGDTAERPVVRRHGGSEVHGRDIVEVGPRRFLVDRTAVHASGVLLAACARVKPRWWSEFVISH